MADSLSHREGLNASQIEFLDESATQLYRMLARAARNGIVPELLIEIENQLSSQTWDDVRESKEG